MHGHDALERDWNLSGRALAAPRIHWPVRTRAIPFGRHLRSGTLAALALLASLALLGPPFETGKPTLDPSWVEAYAHFTRTGAQAGVDYLFTYGPLAYFIAPVFDPALYPTAFVVTTLLGVALAAPLVWFAARRRSLAITLGLAWLAVVLVPRSMGNEVGATCAMITLVFVLLEAGPKPLAAFALGGVIFAALALMKFSLFVFCGFAVGVLILAAGRDRARLKGPLVMALAFALGGVALWRLAGQELANLPTWIAGSVEVAGAYAAAMHTPLDPGQWSVALALGVLVGAQLIWTLLVARRSGELPIALLLFSAAALFLCWKMGVTRSQIPKFYVPAALISVLLAGLATGTRRWWRFDLFFPATALSLATAGVALVYGYTVSDHLRFSTDDLFLRVHHLLQPGARRADLERARTLAHRAYAFPDVKAAVGERTIDVFSHNQSIALFNDLNYHPRPVIQGYQACSEPLAALNGDFYASAEGPEFVLQLAALCPIDGRYPTTEDPKALLMLLRNYRPVLMENHFLLLERARTGSELEEVAPVLGGAGTPEDWVSLPNPDENWQLLDIRMRRSAMGSVRSFLHKPPMPMIEVRLSDGSVRAGRLNEGTGEFLINPVLGPVLSVADWPGALSTVRVEAFRVVMPPGESGLIAGFDYTVRTVKAEG